MTERLERGGPAPAPLPLLAPRALVVAKLLWPSPVPSPELPVGTAVALVVYTDADAVPADRVAAAVLSEEDEARRAWFVSTPPPPPPPGVVCHFQEVGREGSFWLAAQPLAAARSSQRFGTEARDKVFERRREQRAFMTTEVGRKKTYGPAS